MVPHFRTFVAMLILTTLSQISLSSANPADFYEISREYDSSNKVTVSLYYEALCPYCADFIVNHLVKMFQTDLINIVNLRFVPWGNTQILANGTWVCQHGDDECLLDVIEACATKAWPNVKDHFKFIHCIERLHLMNKHTEWRSCFGTTHFDPKPLDNCYNSDFARQLEQSFASETEYLFPTLQFVPWLVVNGYPVQEDYQNFVHYICEAYKGPNIPKACKSRSFEHDSSRAGISTPKLDHH